MTTRRLLRDAAIGSLLLVVTLGACDGSDRLSIGGGEPPDAAVPGPGIAPADASARDAATPTSPIEVAGACIQTECPFPYASCTAPSGYLPTYACETNLARDPLNCGGCGIACPNGGFVGMEINCVQSVCAGACLPEHVDCNGIVDDGCEITPLVDAANCGGCGVVCPAGTPCLNGACGCPFGQTLCGEECVDLKNDSTHCGTCDFACRDHQPEDAGTPPPNMLYACREGTCSALACQTDTFVFADCNSDLTDGCEVQLNRTLEDGSYDPANCGICGKTCEPDQKCVAPPGGGLDCQCPVGQTLCAFDICTDLETDPTACGSCDYSCPTPLLSVDDGHQVATCDRARCGVTCNPGFADCNARPDDGCEAELLHDPRNCGGCGIACDVAAGQPCVNGVCATKPCEGPR